MSSNLQEREETECKKKARVVDKGRDKSCIDGEESRGKKFNAPSMLLNNPKLFVNTYRTVDEVKVPSALVHTVPINH